MSKFLFRKYPGIAKIAVKLADQQVQIRRAALSGYQEIKALKKAGGKGSRFLEPAVLKDKFAGIKEGRKGLNHAITNRQRAGKALAKASATKASPINRTINARGKGVTFIRVHGRIVPIRKK